MSVSLSGSRPSGRGAKDRPGLQAALSRLLGGHGQLPVVFREAPEPALLSTVSGRIVEINPAMRAGIESSRLEPTQRDLGSWLCAVLDCDVSLLYRLSRGALSFGFSLEQVRELGSERLVYLAASRVEDGLLLWRILPVDQVASAVLPAGGDNYGVAPFAYLRLQDGPEPQHNPRFRELFDTDPAAVIEQIMDADGLLMPGRHRLRVRGGEDRLMRVFVPGGREADAEHCEIFIFDLTADEAAGGGAVSDLDDLPSALLQLLPDGHVLSMNTQARRALADRLSPGDNLADVISCRGRPLTALFEEARSGAGQGQVDMVYLTGEGAEKPLQITVSPSRSDGGNTMVAVLNDASELQSLQDKYAQSQKMEAVGKLAGGVAHDFNNLITAINGHCDLLLLGKDATQAEYSDLMQIRQNANRAAALVRQLLAFSRKQTLNPTMLSPSDVISDTLYLLDRLIGDRVRLSVDPDPSGRLGAILADNRQLEQALMNLVVNARDAMPRGGTVTISTRRRRFRSDVEREGSLIPAGDYVELAVADEGTGIDEATIGKVFDPFFTTKAQGEGTGLGLSTVYGIVSQSGGFVFAENRPEGGACFRMLFPRIEPQEATEAKPETMSSPDLTGQGAVLLVEDEAAVRSFATRALRLRGYDVSTAEEAEDALEMLEDEGRHFDLIVSDVMMPGMDGPALVARARQMRPDLAVLFVSGYAEEAFRKDIENPDYHFLAKPFSLAELTAKVKEIMAKIS